LPAIAGTPFRDEWATLKSTVAAGRIKVGLFGGCAQDFIYPEQLRAAVGIFAAKNIAADFPLEQSCCGLPLQMMGERKAAEDVAIQNIQAFAGGDMDYIVTLCASCASHLKHKYQSILEKRTEFKAETRKFVDRIIDFSSFMSKVVGLKADDLKNSGEAVCYHAPCHQCRGMGVTEEPRALMRAAANYIQTEEEDVCCGFGGSYSLKFPEISNQLLNKKLTRLEASGASTLLTECPGCIMQLRGGEEKRGRRLKVEHMSEFLLRQIK
jgi:Fe-S oxidoreductase